MATPNTLTAIKNTVRRIVSAPSTLQLSESDLEDYINAFYVQEMPLTFKTDQLRTVYELFTAPNQDVYSVDVNQYQEFQDPVLVNGRPGNLLKDRQTFWTKWSKQATVERGAATGDGTIGPYAWTTSATPILKSSVVIGTLDTSSTAMKVEDDGTGNLVLAGTSTNVGSVNYLTGAVSFSPIVAVLSGQNINMWYRPYTTGYPIDVLFWNNEITVRPVPDDVYKIEINAILSPTAFAQNSDRPVLDEWWQFIALGASLKILRDRQDMDGVSNMMPLFERQRALILERQSSEEIGQRNSTIYSGETGYGPSYYERW